MKPSAVAIIVVAIFAVMVAIVLPMPVTKTVKRSRVIAAPVDRVRAELVDLRSWDVWLWPRGAQRVAGTSTFEEDGGLWRWKTIDGRTPALRRVSISDDALVYEAVDGPKARETLHLSADGDGGTRVEWVHDITLSGPAKLAPLIKTPETVVGPMLEDNLEALSRRF